MGLSEDFNKAAEVAKKLPKKPSDNDLLLLYANYKQVKILIVIVALPNNVVS